MEKGEPIVVVKEISKSYGKVEALKEVSFAVEQGEVFGLIGPDGYLIPHPDHFTVG